MRNETIFPGEQRATVALILTSATSFRVRLPIRLNSIFLRTLFALKLLFAVLAAIVFLDSSEVSKGPRRIMVNTSLDRTYVYFLLYHLFVGPLLQLPWKVVATAMEL